MSKVIVDKSGSLIKYDDDKDFWEADAIFNSEKKEVLIVGTKRKLTDEERSNIITVILNKYFFGNYLNYENDLNNYKLKNRLLDKKQESNINERAYSILGETIIELNKNNEECEKISEFRSIYLHLKILTEDAKREKKKLNDSVDFLFEGLIFEFRKYKRIIDDLIPEFEYSLSKLYDKKVNIEYSGNLKKGKTILTFTIKEV